MAEQGRRERKKARTRQSISDAALELFLEHGYEEVTLREVAEAADIAASTLFTHFPTKEALVFDLDRNIESGLVTAISERNPGVTVLAALQEHMENHHLHGPAGEDNRVRRLIDETPALSSYARSMWQRHEGALASAIAEAEGFPEDDYRAAALARFALAVPDLAERQPKPAEALRGLFHLVAEGWNAVVVADHAHATDGPK